jgi:hypothetical protein
MKATTFLTSRVEVQRAKRILGVALVALIVGGIFASDSTEALFAYLLVALAAVLPTVLWLFAGAPGIPVFPVIGLMYFVYYAVPILRNNVGRAEYAPSEILGAAVIVVLFLLAAAFSWRMMLIGIGGQVRKAVGELNYEKRLNQLIFIGFGISIAYFLLLYSPFADSFGPLFSVVRSIAGTSCVLASFLLGHARARGLLRGNAWIMALAALCAVVVLTLSSLFLAGAVAYVMAALIGYVITCKRIPWATVIMAVLVVTVLHAGKGDMRKKFWLLNTNSVGDVTLTDVPQLLVMWVEEGASVLISGSSATPVIDRISLLQLLLRVQRLTPDYVNYLGGETYALLPYMLVPRFVSTDKIQTQASMMLLNVRFGFQSEQSASVTAIGWGLVAEGYANYGMLGVIGVGLVFGLICGVLMRWSHGHPLISIPALISIVGMMTFINLEADLSYVLTTFWQGAVSVTLFFIAFQTILGKKKKTVAGRRVATSNYP